MQILRNVIYKLLPRPRSLGRPAENIVDGRLVVFDKVEQAIEAYYRLNR